MVLPIVLSDESAAALIRGWVCENTLEIAGTIEGSKFANYLGEQSAMNPRASITAIFALQCDFSSKPYRIIGRRFYIP
jgi:hypothetical protein